MSPAATAASAKRWPGRWPWPVPGSPSRAATLAKAETLAGEMRAAGHEAMGLAMDAHSVADIRTSVDAVRAALGGLDILVNCVGMQREQPLLEVTRGDLR